MNFSRIAARFRPEEVISLAIFVPMAYAVARMIGVPPDVAAAAAAYPSSLVRFIALLVAAAFFFWLIRYRPQWNLVRDAMPFVFCGSVYANLHDLIVFYGAPDITATLHRWDVQLFGIEPSVWAERFIHPFLTDFFTFCYWLFYVWGPLLGLILYLRKDVRAFRFTMVSVVLCLFMGYVGYVAWPAAAPRLAIPEAYSIPLRGGSALLDATRAATAAVPLTTQGAFPSLHCAIALLALLLAWKHLRWCFWVQLPFGAGLIVGTVYLRHHWVVDILAGFILAIIALWAGPRVENAWNRVARRDGDGRSKSTAARRFEPRIEEAERSSAGGM